MDEVVVVRRKVFDVARHVEAFGENPAFHFAEMVCDAYREAGEHEKADFWREVKIHLQAMECVSRDAKIIIEPD